MVKHEVELRGPITWGKYKEILDFMNNNAKLIKKEKQTISYYLHPEFDLRIKRIKDRLKLVVKSGEMGDKSREEIEVELNSKEIKNLRKLLGFMGFNKFVDWPRDRILYNFKGFEFALDYIPGFGPNSGPCFEIEKVCEEKEIEKCKKEMNKVIQQLGIKAVSKERLHELIHDYNKRFLRKV
jgi:predicted adenylyl cyclase CyaB